MIPALFLLALAVIIVLGVPPVRRRLISAPLMGFAGKQLPTIGDTERIALEAGTVWWEGEMFSGKPDWRKLLDFTIKPLSREEKAFLDGPVDELCRMLDDFKVAQDRDLPPAVWAFIKKHKFFGMIIPKAHGGLGFSAAAHSAVVMKLASRSVTAAVTVMVPNSLGPGELLLRYGTKAQQKHYLPRLAEGLDIPCFALTEPHAGSDAASARSFGVAAHGTWKGKKVLGIRLTFNKRYITLAPVATVIGLAFRLYDPDHLLGDKEDIGITCALLPRDLKGLHIGNRHDPMGVPFQNGPLWGKDVFIPLEFIIGGKDYAGHGWRMLMEALAAGRGISLPSLSVGAAKVSARAVSAYAHVREQFGLPIGKFEGVRERIARIAGHAYFMDAVRTMTCGAVDAGEHPAVASAIAKAYLTEGMRLAINDGMDVMAGAAICRGPRNIFTRAYMSIPIGITVEGSNILTRSLIVFGQGAIRCHPYLQREVDALARRDAAAFDKALFGHIGHALGNVMRSLLLGLGLGLLRPVPKTPYARHFRSLNRMSAAFALLADMGLITLGGSLKRREYLSGRYADAFAWLFIASSVLKRAHDDGYVLAHKPLVDWAMRHALHEIETALDGVLRNLPNRFVAALVRPLVFPLGMRARPASDRLADGVVDNLLADDSDVRSHLAAMTYIPDADEPGMGRLEHAMRLLAKTVDARKALAQAQRAGNLPKGLVDAALLGKAVKAGVISAADKAAVAEALRVADDAVQVDYYTPAVYKTLK